MDSLISISFNHPSLTRSWSCLQLDIWSTWQTFPTGMPDEMLTQNQAKQYSYGSNICSSGRRWAWLLCHIVKLPYNVITLWSITFNQMLSERDGRTYLLLLQLHFFRHWIWCEEAREIHNWGKDCIGEKGRGMPVWNKKPQRQMMPWRCPQVCGRYNEKGRKIPKSYNPIRESRLTLFL